MTPNNVTRYFNLQDEFFKRIGQIIEILRQYRETIPKDIPSNTWYMEDAHPAVTDPSKIIISFVDSERDECYIDIPRAYMWENDEHIKKCEQRFLEERTKAREEKERQELEEAKRKAKAEQDAEYQEYLRLKAKYDPDSSGL